MKNLEDTKNQNSENNPVPSLDNKTKEWVKYYFKGYISEEVIEDFIYKLEDKLENGVETDNQQPKQKHSCTIKNACPDCGGDVHDGTGTGWEICKNPKCDWMG